MTGIRASLFLLLCWFTIASSDSLLSETFETQLTPEELAEGWISLFDGQTLFGWRPACKADWHVDEGAIVVTQGEAGLLRTTAQFSDYVLRLEFRCDESANSGVFLRTNPDPRDPSRDCYEVNIAGPDHPFPTGSLAQRKRAGTMAAREGWQAMELTADGGELTVKVDGHLVLQYHDPTPLGRGFIGLQHNEGKVEFRNIRLKPLGLRPLFNGTTLDGWVLYPDMKSVFRVTPEGHLNVKDGRGQLETADRFGDFVLQLECFSNGRHLNSGIFFRCIPGEEMMGYESQIHNGYIEGDRTRPVDCGTGGIFRRKDARLVAADDFQWFYKTMVVEGPHVAVWVNGYQVTDWSDQRKPHSNPRKGRRLEPGTIMIQGHDPTTDLSFRNIRAGEMPERWSPSANEAQ